MRIPSRLSRREMLGLAALPAVGAAGWSLRHLAGSWSAATLEESSIPLPDAPDVERLRLLAGALKPFFVPLPAPAPDDWLAKHIEFGQTFVQFVASNPDKLIGRYRRVCIVRLGELSESQLRLFDDTGDYLERFFGFPVERSARDRMAAMQKTA